MVDRRVLVMLDEAVDRADPRPHYAGREADDDSRRAGAGRAGGAAERRSHARFGDSAAEQAPCQILGAREQCGGVVARRVEEDEQARPWLGEGDRGPGEDAQLDREGVDVLDPQELAQSLQGGVVAAVGFALSHLRARPTSRTDMPSK